jgi:cellulose biosynthesis protein BcsQ
MSTPFNPRDVFDGAERQRQYGEEAAPAAAVTASAEPTATATTMVAPGRHSLLPAAPEELRTGSKSGLARLLRRRRFPTEEDNARLARNEATIRQFTATSSKNVLIANPKSSGKTSTALSLGGTLAQVRGGSVAITEATPAPGDLFARAEGQPRLGLSDLLARGRQISSAGELAGYTAPQTSKAAVIGSAGARRELTPDDVLVLRDVLATYYQLTVTDTGNNCLSSVFRSALNIADAVVVPVTCTLASVRGAQSVANAIAAAGLAGHLAARVVVVITHDGAHEDPQLSAELQPTLGRLFPDAAIVDVPYDPAIRADVVELSLGRLSLRSRHAWTAMAAAAVHALSLSEQHPSPINPTSLTENN